MLAPWKESHDKSKQCNKKQTHHFANKSPCSQSYGFSSSHVRMEELDHKEGWAPKNWCLLTVVLEKTLESPLDCKGIQPVHPKGNQSWIFMEGLILKLKLQHFGHLMWRTDSSEKPLVLRMIEGEGDNRGWDGLMASLTWRTWIWACSRNWWWTGKPGAAVLGVTKSWTWLSA